MKTTSSTGALTLIAICAVWRAPEELNLNTQLCAQFRKLQKSDTLLAHLCAHLRELQRSDIVTL